MLIKMHVALSVIAAALLGYSSDFGAAEQSAGYIIFDSGQVKMMLSQCSRVTPPPGEGTWMPTAIDIKKFEVALEQDRRVRENEKNFPKAFGRQYVGITRAGNNLIYGNFFPFLSGDEFKYWRRAPVSVCDGGVAFFGAEFDLGSGKITHIAFNGYA